MPKTTDLTPGGVIGNAIISMPFGALAGLVSGSLGKVGISFFSSSMASAAGTAATFAGVGAIAAPLVIIPVYIVNKILANNANNEFLKTRPKLAKFLADTANFLITLGAVTASATLLGASWPATIMAMMVIPTIIYALSTLCNVINACFDACKTPESNLSCAM